MRALQMFPQRLDIVEVLLSSCGREVKEERGKVKVGFVEIWFRSFSNVSVPYVTLWWWGGIVQSVLRPLLMTAGIGPGWFRFLWRFVGRTLNTELYGIETPAIIHSLLRNWEGVKKRMIFECPLLDLRAPSAGSTVWDVFRLCLSVRFELLPQGLNGIWTCWSDSYCWVRWDKKRKNPELLWV